MEVSLTYSNLGEPCRTTMLHLRSGGRKNPTISEDRTSFQITAANKTTHSSCWQCQGSRWLKRKTCSWWHVLQSMYLKMKLLAWQQLTCEPAIIMLPCHNEKLVSLLTDVICASKLSDQDASIGDNSCASFEQCTIVIMALCHWWSRFRAP
jgi:hypothetical protein